MRKFDKYETREVREMRTIVAEAAEVVSTPAGRQVMRQAIAKMDEYIAQGDYDDSEDEQDDE